MALEIFCFVLILKQKLVVSLGGTGFCSKLSSSAKELLLIHSSNHLCGEGNSSLLVFFLPLHTPHPRKRPHPNHEAQGLLTSSKKERSVQLSRENSKGTPESHLLMWCERKRGWEETALMESLLTFCACRSKRTLILPFVLRPSLGPRFPSVLMHDLAADAPSCAAAGQCSDLWSPPAWRLCQHEEVPALLPAGVFHVQLAQPSLCCFWQWTSCFPSSLWVLWYVGCHFANCYVCVLCCKRLTVGKEWYQRHNAELQPSFLYMDGSCTRYLGPPQGSSAHAYVCGGGGGGGGGRVGNYIVLSSAGSWKL